MMHIISQCLHTGINYSWSCSWTAPRETWRRGQHSKWLWRNWRRNRRNMRRMIIHDANISYSLIPYPSSSPSDGTISLDFGLFPFLQDLFQLFPSPPAHLQNLSHHETQIAWTFSSRATFSPKSTSCNRWTSFCMSFSSSLCTAWLHLPPSCIYLW